MTDTKILVLGFWDAVIECLVQFHKKDYGEAYLLALDLRRRLAGIGARLDEIDLFYHEEPFEVACSLAGNKLDVDSNRPQYASVLGKAYGSPAMDGNSSPSSPTKRGTKRSLGPSNSPSRLEEVYKKAKLKEKEPARQVRRKSPSALQGPAGQSR